MNAKSGLFAGFVTFALVNAGLNGIYATRVTRRVTVL